MAETVHFTKVRPETLDLLRKRADDAGISVDGLLELAIVAYDRASRPKSSAPRPAAPVARPALSVTVHKNQGSENAPVARPVLSSGGHEASLSKRSSEILGSTASFRQSTPEFIDFASEQDKAIILNDRHADFFLHAGIIGVFVNGVRSVADSWGTAIQVMCDEVAKAQNRRGDDLARFLKTNIPGFRVVPGRNTQNGYKYNPNLNISVQVMSTAKNAESALKMASMAKVRLAIFVRWRPAAGSSLRGRLGLVGEKLDAPT